MAGRGKRIGRPPNKRDLVQQCADHFGIKRETALRYLREGAPIGYGTLFAEKMRLTNEQVHGTRYAQHSRTDGAAEFCTLTPCVPDCERESVGAAIPVPSRRPLNRTPILTLVEGRANDQT